MHVVKNNRCRFSFTNFDHREGFSRNKLSGNPISYTYMYSSLYDTACDSAQSGFQVNNFMTICLSIRSDRRFKV